jgi:hypothetical protein
MFPTAITEIWLDHGTVSKAHLKLGKAASESHTLPPLHLWLSCVWLTGQGYDCAGQLQLWPMAVPLLSLLQPVASLHSGV